MDNGHSVNLPRTISVASNRIQHHIRDDAANQVQPESSVMMVPKFPAPKQKNNFVESAQPAPKPIPRASGGRLPPIHNSAYNLEYQDSIQTNIKAWKKAGDRLAPLPQHHSYNKAAPKPTPTDLEKRQLKVRKALKRLMAKTGGQHNMFQRLDTDMTDKITRSEFESAVFKTGAIARQATVDLLFEALDGDKSGAVTMAEFGQMMVNVKMEEDAKRLRRVRGHPLKVGSATVATPRVKEQLRAHQISNEQVKEGIEKKTAVQTDIQRALVKVKRRAQHSGRSSHSSANTKLVSGAGLYSALGMFDSNGDGTVSVEELDLALKMIGCPIEKPTLHKIAQVYDTDQSGTLQREEVVSAFFPKAKVLKV